jgi:hypothetical protein
VSSAEKSNRLIKWRFLAQHSSSVLPLLAKHTNAVAHQRTNDYGNSGTERIDRAGYFGGQLRVSAAVPGEDANATVLSEDAKMKLAPLLTRPRRLARPRTSPFHGGNTGSNPVGDAKSFQQLTDSPPF